MWMFTILILSAISEIHATLTQPLQLSFNVSNVTVSRGRFQPQTIEEVANVVRDHHFKVSTFSKTPNLFYPWTETKNELSADVPLLKFETGMVYHNLANLKQGRNFEVSRSRRYELEWSLGNPLKHGFIAAATTAYNLHLPLELSPDDFWLLTAFSVSQFLSQNETSDHYRDQFINHEGKKELVVWIKKYGIYPHGNTEANRAGWPPAICDMMQKIIENTKTNFSNIMTDPFSTSGISELTALRVSLMDSMKNYFQYTFAVACGIPKVTLHGSVADYVDLLDRIDKLVDLLPDFNWYLSRIRRHAQKLVQSAQGKPDVEWWENMVKIQTDFGCGGPPEHILTGWMVDWIAYYHKGDKLLKVEPSPWDKSGITSMDIEDLDYPAVTMTEVKLKDFTTGRQYPMIFSGGFLGVSQNNETGALRPAIGWLTFYNGDSEEVEPIRID